MNIVAAFRRTSTTVWVSAALSLALLAGGMLISHPKASAGTCGPMGIGYFSGNDYSCIVYGPGGDDVDRGHFSATTNKAAFINMVNTSRAANFIKNVITNRQPANFANDMSNPRISVRVINQTTATNSLYLPGQGDYAFYQDFSPVSAPSLVLYDNVTGALYTIIKIDCGNPLNSIPIPNFIANRAPTGSFTFACVGNEGGRVTISFSDPDGATHAYVRIDGVTRTGRLNNGAVVNVSGYTAWQSHAIALAVEDVDASGTIVRQVVVATQRRGPCGRVSCNNTMTNMPATLIAGSPVTFRVWTAFSGAPGGPPGATFTSIRVTGPSTYSATSGYTVTGANLYSANQTFTPTGSGTYTLTWSFGGGSSNPATVNCGSRTIDVAFAPYLSVIGGDIVAGTGFGDGSCTETTADIKSNSLNAPSYFGAGSEQSAWATGSIENFVTGMGLSGGAASQAGKGLSFASTTSNYGGQFGANSLNCTPDYYGRLGTTGGSPLSGTVSPATLASNNYQANGILTLTAGVIPAGRNITIYVHGDVYITGNITYAAYTLATVPRFNLYVQGNIYIKSDSNAALAVTELHGVYVAQKEGGAKGDIKTCAIGVSSAPLPYATCNQPLRIVGSASAEGELHLNRTYGNLTAAGSVPAAAGETFEYSPELWLNAPSNTNLGIKSYTSLPPVL